MRHNLANFSARLPNDCVVYTVLSSKAEQLGSLERKVVCVRVCHCCPQDLLPCLLISRSWLIPNSTK